MFFLSFNKNKSGCNYFFYINDGSSRLPDLKGVLHYNEPDTLGVLLNLKWVKWKKEKWTSKERTSALNIVASTALKK